MESDLNLFAVFFLIVRMSPVLLLSLLLSGKSSAFSCLYCINYTIIQLRMLTFNIQKMEQN